jgi:hypothetical protein
MIRLATHSDIPRLLELDRATNPFPWEEKVLDRVLSFDRAKSWVYENRDGVIVAFASVLISPESAHWLNFRVEPGKQKGIYIWQLGLHILHELLAQKIMYVYAEVMEDNLPLVRGIERMGFKLKVLNLIPNYYGEKNGAAICIYL